MANLLSRSIGGITQKTTLSSTPLQSASSTHTLRVTKVLILKKAQNLSGCSHQRMSFSLRSLSNDQFSKKVNLKAPSDYQIKSKYIQLVNPASTLNQNDQSESTNSPSSLSSLIEPALTREVLERLDLNKFTLIQVNSKAQPPICKIVSKESLIEKERLKLKQLKLQKKVNRHDSVVKEIQLSWSISLNDLNHKLKLVRQSFEKSYRVRIVISSNRGQQEVGYEVRDELLGLIEDEISGMGGEKVKEESEGRKLMIEWHAPNLSKQSSSSN